MKVIIILSTIAFNGYFQVIAQNNIKGIIKEFPSNLPVYDVHVINKARQSYAISNNSGQFAIPALQGDHLVLTRMGYKMLTFSADSNITFSDTLILYMVADTIELEEVEVYDKDWKGFKAACKEYNAFYSPDKISLTGVWQIEGPIVPVPPTIFNPAEYLYSILGKEARRERRLNRYRNVLKENNPDLETGDENIFTQPHSPPGN